MNVLAKWPAAQRRRVSPSLATAQNIRGVSGWDLGGGINFQALIPLPLLGRNLESLGSECMELQL